MHTIDILHIEDDQYNIELTQRVLRKHKLETGYMSLSDGEQAINFFNEQVLASYARPRLILLDLKMPKVDGITLLKKIRQEYVLSAPVVVFTSSSNAKDIQAALQAGANSYVVKPLPFDRFEQVLYHIAYYWLHVHQVSDQ